MEPFTIPEVRVSKDFRLRFICRSVPRGCTLPMVLILPALLNAVLLLAVIITLQVFIHGLGKESIDGKETSVSRREMLIVNWAASALLWAWIVVSPPFIIGYLQP